MSIISTQLSTYIRTFLVILLLVSFGIPNQSYAQTDTAVDTTGFVQFKGKIIGSKSKSPLVFATLEINGTNISTITNTQGNFVLKVPNIYLNNRVTVSFLGYTSKVIKIADLKPENNVIRLETYIEELNEVTISVKDARSLVKEVLKRKGENYFTDLTNMTAFYRETIKKRRTYVSLAEAVVDISKQPYTSNRNDILQLYKARKSTDYTKLDTIALKLRGGPFSTLYLDIMKNPTMFLTEDMDDIYEFHFDESTKIDNRVIYVVSFKQRSYVEDPMFYGKLYIDANNLALTRAEFDLNLDDVNAASRLFILRKPPRAKVHPTMAKYQVDYRQKDGKWFYGYSRIELEFKVNWEKKLFNTTYLSTIEMAITDWEKSNDKKFDKPKDRLRTTVILTDEASGFSDPKFWGEYNVIEPEKPIESAIRKIQKQLNRSSGK